MQNLAKIHDDNGYAVFLPAVSGFYATMLAKYKEDVEERRIAEENGDTERLAKPEFIPADRIPAGFENGIAGMDFLNPDGYFYYNKCLYSAGHAYLDIEKSKVKEDMIQNRDRSKITLVGDSGGFQIGKGIIKFDWERFYETKDDSSTWIDGKYVGSADATRMKILQWLEHTAEWSMTLDVPTWACDVHNRDKTGLTSFDDCLKATLHNNDYFVKNRVPGATKFLNVLQGGDFLEAQTWYDAVKHYPFEGWAFGGNNMRDMSMALKRLIIMRDEGQLEGKDWIHFLGTSKLDWACYLTAVQRQIRKHINPNLTISFDCASPYIAAANGLTYTSYFHTPDKWTYAMDSCPDSKSLKDSTMPYPFESEIGNRLTMGDICVYGDAHATVNGTRDDTVTEDEVKLLQESGIDAQWVEADLNKIKKVGKTSWDSFSYALVMSHSVYQHIRSVQVANQLTDVESALYKPDVREWKKLKGRDKSGELSKWVPRNILYFSSFVEELFVHDDPLAFIDENQPFLDAISQRRNASGNTLHFNSLFDDVVEQADDDTFTDPDDAHLSSLEHDLRD